MKSVIKYTIQFAKKNIPWNNSYINAVRVTDYGQFDKYLQLFDIINDDGSLANYSFKMADSVNAIMVVDFKNASYTGSIQEYLNLNYAKVIATFSDGSTKAYYYFLKKSLLNSYCRITFNLELDIFVTYPLNVDYEIDGVICKRRHMKRYDKLENNGVTFNYDFVSSNLKKEEIEDSFSNRDIVIKFGETFDNLIKFNYVDNFLNSSIYKNNYKGWLVLLYTFGGDDGGMARSYWNGREYPILVLTCPIGIPLGYTFNFSGNYKKGISVNSLYDGDLDKFTNGFSAKLIKSYKNSKIDGNYKVQYELTSDINFKPICHFFTRFCPFELNNNSLIFDDYLSYGNSFVFESNPDDYYNMQNTNQDFSITDTNLRKKSIIWDNYIYHEGTNLSSLYAFIKVNNVRTTYKTTNSIFNLNWDSNLKDKIKKMILPVQNNSNIDFKNVKFNHKDFKLIKFPFSSIGLNSMIGGNREFDLSYIFNLISMDGITVSINTGEILSLDNVFEFDYFKLSSITLTDDVVNRNFKNGLFYYTNFNYPIFSDVFINMVQTNKNYLTSHYLNLGTEIVSSSFGVAKGIAKKDIGGIVSNVLSPISNEINFNLNMDNLKSTPDTLVNKNINNSSLGLGYSSMTTYLTFNTIPENEQRQVSDYFYKFGYEDNEISNSIDWINRYIFNYVQTQTDIRGNMKEFNDNNFSEDIKLIISNAFQRGITIWEFDSEHLHFFNYEYENWEKSLLN